MNAATAPAPLPAQARLLAQNVISSTFQIVHGVRDAGLHARIRGLMAERRHWLAELARYMDAHQHAGSLAALSAAVAESDRTLEALIAQAPGDTRSTCTRASTPSS